ncbi:MAG: YidH family protein [Nitrospirota bacterium]
MSAEGNTEKDTKPRDRRVHMANERTFLAWVRTSISIMAFGFVVEKFSLFVKQLSFYLGKETTPPPPGVSSIIGILLVGLGALMGVLAYLQYRKVEQQIENDSYVPSRILSVLLTLAIVTIGLFLILYLVHTL